MPRGTSLNATDETLLTARFVEYRGTPPAEKEAFRDACAKYILRARNLDENNEYLVELFSVKVRNWFQNNTEKKQVRLPMRIHQSFDPIRIFGHKNRDLVRATVAKENASNEAESPAYIVQWNATVRRLWDALPEEERRPYVHLTELWSEQGPDDDLKPWMAERRSGAWLRAVANMFWVQCGMPVFIYGMFKDTNGKLRATVYDTMELWGEAEPSTPRFRSIKDWDVNFRRSAWSFFQAILDLEQASQQTIDLMQATRRQAAPIVVFDLYPDGTPLLPEQPVTPKNGPPTSRRQQVLREYFRLHYSHAKGQDVRSVPWQSLRETPENFFAPGMLPDGFVLQDPSHITDREIAEFHKHVSAMENGTNGEAIRFRFSHFEMGPKGKRTYLPAIYSGTFEPVERRRQKKPVNVPGFDGAPSDGESDGTRVLQPPIIRLGGSNARVGSRMATALVADFARVQAGLIAEASSQHSKDSTPEVQSPVSGGGDLAPATKGKGKQKAAEPWLDAQFDATVAATDEWLDDELDLLADLPDLLSPDPTDVSNGLEHSEGLAFASDEEVEEVLHFATRPAAAADDTAPSVPTDIAPVPSNTLIMSQSPLAMSSVPQRRRPTRPFESPNPPASIPRDGDQRLAYLRALAAEKAYLALIDVMESKLRELATVRGKSPVMWCTWGHKSGHVPESIYTSEANVKKLMDWVIKGTTAAASAADVQRYCLVVGLILSDLDFVDDTTGVVPWPDSLPGYLAYSGLEEHRSDVLQACERVAASYQGSEGVVEPETSTAVPDRGSRRADSARPLATKVVTVPAVTGEGSATNGRRTRSKARRG